MAEFYPVLVGIFVGFLLNEFRQFIKAKWSRKEKLEQINEELKSNYHQIPQKKDHIRKIIDSLDETKLLPGISVEFIRTYYSNYLRELYPHLSALERNSLHVIYQYCEIIDKIMNNFEGDVLNFLSLKLMKKSDQVYQVFSQKMREVLSILEKTEELIKKHLEGDPIDVYYINQNKKPEKFY